MKKLNFLTFLTSFLIASSCTNNQSSKSNERTFGESIDPQTEIAEAEKAIERVSLDESRLPPQAKTALGEFKKLYNELLEFKDTENFKSYGFAVAGQYNWWQKRVDNLRDNEILMNEGIFFGDLMMLGISYAGSEGQETSDSQILNKRIYRALNPIKLDKTEAPIGRENYEKIKKEYDLLGRWKITTMVSEKSYPLEIYKKGEFYLSVVPSDDWEFQTEILEKREYGTL